MPTISRIRSKMTLEEDIMESADHSTSRMTVINCTQGDLERHLAPIAKFLARVKGDAITTKARADLVALYVKDQEIQERVFKGGASSFALELYDLGQRSAPAKSSDSVHDALKKRLEPIAQRLEQSRSGYSRKAAKALRRIYERRYSDTVNSNPPANFNPNTHTFYGGVIFPKSRT